MAVSTSNIETSLGRPLATAELAQAIQWIADATMLISTRFGDAFAALDPILLDYVIRESVTARIRAAGENGASSVSVSVDDGSVTRRWENQSAARHDGWLIPGWLDLLSPDRESQAFSTRPGFDVDTARWSPSTSLSDPDLRGWV